MNEHNWKACKRQKRFGGSNPPLSALQAGKHYTQAEQVLHFFVAFRRFMSQNTGK